MSQNLTENIYKFKGVLEFPLIFSHWRPPLFALLYNQFLAKHLKMCV